MNLDEFPMIFQSLGASPAALARSMRSHPIHGRFTIVTSTGLLAALASTCPS